ncbi:MAG: carbohydrate ABC transporter permease [Actinomycetota bacterium]
MSSTALKQAVASVANPPTPLAGSRPAWRRALGRVDHVVSPYLFVSPFFALFLVFGLFPILYTAYVSLHDWNIIGTHEWVGWQNYATLWADPRFWNALGNTVSIWALSTFPQLALALMLAHVLNERVLRGKTFFRMSLLVPNVTSVVAVAIIFESIFGLHYGLANFVTEALGFDRINWQAGTLTSHIAIATMVTWRWMGYNALIYLAALQSVPRDLYEASAIDGAGRRQQFRHVTIPMLRPTIIFTLIVSTIGGLQIFAEPLLFATAPGVSGGSARQFQTLTLFLYEQSFRSFKFGYASAIAWVLFLVIVVAALVNYRFVRRIRSAED